MSSLSADQIAGLFAQRLPATGGWVSEKQIDWLLSSFARENRIPRPRSANGVLEDGREWTAHKSGNRNGAGTLHFVAPQTLEARGAVLAQEAYEARCREINTEAASLLLAGKLDEARALLERFAAEQSAH